MNKSNNAISLNGKNNPINQNEEGRRFFVLTWKIFKDFLYGIYFPETWQNFAVSCTQYYKQKNFSYKIRKKKNSFWNYSKKYTNK